MPEVLQGSSTPGVASQCQGQHQLLQCQSLVVQSVAGTVMTVFALSTKSGAWGCCPGHPHSVTLLCNAHIFERDLICKPGPPPLHTQGRAHLHTHAFIRAHTHMHISVQYIVDCIWLSVSKKSLLICSFQNI